MLAGGGSHGAWQAGCLKALCDAGLVFDKVLGFSIGSITGASYFLGMDELLLDRWRSMDERPILRFSPSLRTLSLYSIDPVLEAVSHTGDEEQAKRKARCEFVVVSHCVEERALHYSRFTPRAESGWDGPLASKLAGSCAVPTIFPAVTVTRDGVSRRHIDGGVPGREAMHFDHLADCRDLIVLQMIRPEEIGWSLNWLRRPGDQLGREAVHRIISKAIDSLRWKGEAGRIFRFFPSRVLSYDQLHFKTRYCAPALEQGLSDAGRFLARPADYIVRSGPAELASGRL